MNTFKASNDSRVLGWGALTVAVLVIAAFLTTVRPSSDSASLPAGNTGVTAAHALRTPGHV